MNPKAAFTVFILLVSSITSFAQINVVVADFKNESDALFLDAWERSVPELLKSELSGIEGIVILEREKLDAIFEEQRLALAGFVDDSALVRQVGNLAGADVIISGSVYKLGKRTRIDANITRVKTTEVRTEKAEAPDAGHLKEMIDILANNIKYQLTGTGKYRESLSIARYPTKYFFAATAGFGISALLMNKRYQDNYDKYHTNSEIEKFDDYYDKANSSRKIAVTLASLGTASLIGTFYCWIKNSTTDDITARSQAKGVSYFPVIELNNNDEVCLNVRIHF